jgi:hypothetical protein
MQYPELAQELLRMAKDDQHDARNMYRVMDAMPTKDEKERYRQNMADNFHARAKRMLEILDTIGVPTFENIGREAAETVSLLALHSYLDEMKQVLAVYERQFSIDPDSIYKQAIPPLTDRIMIAEQCKQKFGTNWNVTKDGTWYLVTLENFARANELRAVYGLSPMRKPRNLTVGATEWPLGNGPAVASDQKEMNDEEHAEYVRHMQR